MKKLLTILLALLVVTGVVFAEDEPADAKLKLTAEKGLVLKHGISGSQVTSGDSLTPIEEATKEVLIQNNWKSSSDAQTWGNAIYYTILTNASTDVSVTVDMSPLVLETDGDAVYYVPYILHVGDDNFDFGNDVVPGLNEIGDSEGNELNLGWSSLAMRYYNGLIGVDIVGDTLQAMEGSYSATVTFGITNDN